MPNTLIKKTDNKASKYLRIIDAVAILIILSAVTVVIAETWPLFQKHFGWTFIAYYGGLVLLASSLWWLLGRAGGTK